MKEQLTWDEVERAANEMFSVFVGRPELAWGKQAWQFLSEAGLLDIETEFDRHRALFRLLVLGGIFRDFCDAAWEESSYLPYSDWASTLDTDPFVIGQLYARLADWCEDEQVEVDNALEFLVEDRRREVVKVLTSAFGGRNGLFASLWTSSNSQDEDPDDPFSPLTVERMKAFEWVSEGCPRYG